MRKSLLCTIVLAAACLLLGAQETRAQYAYGASGIGYDPNTKIVYGYSRTSVDYYAGAYYDPYVEGFLYDPFALRDWGYSRGYENWYPAEVGTAALSAPSTRYDVISDHYVISWYSVSVTICDYYGFYGGCGYDPYGFGNFFGGAYGGFNYFYGGYGGYVPERTYYLGTTGISGVTPADECEGEEEVSAAMAPAETSAGMSSGAMAEGGSTMNYEATSSTSRDTVSLAAGGSCPLPSPKVTVTEVGFKGDYKIKRWAEGVATNQTVIDPNDNEPTWVRGRDGNDKFPVAYKMGTRPTIFAKFTVQNADNTSAKIRAKKGTTVITGEYTVTLDGQPISINDVGIVADLEATPKVKRSNYDFTWEVLYDGQSQWKTINSSGGHRIHWLWDDPKGPEFTNAKKQPFAGLFDRALDHSTGELGDGETTIPAIITKINKELASDISYNPGLLFDADAHPLALFDGREAQCSDNAELLRGLLRSIGIDGTTKYYWGGNNANGDRYSFQFAGQKMSIRTDRDQLVETARTIPADPHFTFHAMVNAGGKFYDPSYGTEYASVSFLETYDFPTRTFNGPATAANNLVVRDHNMLTTYTDHVSQDRCPHSGVAGSGGTTNSTAFVAQSAPTTMEAGQSYAVSVTMRNTGDTTWTEADLYRLGAQNPQDNYTWGFNRTTLPAAVPPGGEVTFDFWVTAPSYAGLYNFQWQMVRDGVEWFGAPTGNLTIQVTQPLIYCQPNYYEEQNCSMYYGGYWDYNTCSCQYGYYYY